MGPRRVLLFGGLCAASGMALLVLTPFMLAAPIGIALVGLGASNIVPVLYSSLGLQRAMPANLAVSAVTALGYSGILVGLAGIGYVASRAGLPAVFFVVAGLLLVVAACSGAVTRRDFYQQEV